jgi:hypothetical protein
MELPTGHISVYKDGWVGLLRKEPTPRNARVAEMYPIAYSVEVKLIDGEYVADLTIIND